MSTVASAPTARTVRSRGPVDVDRFAADVSAAIAAFAVDVSYAVAMARAAVTITRKRAVWQARRDALDAEAAAREHCADAEPFTCHTISPCGTGDCKYAGGEMTLLDLDAAHGPGVRPQHRNAGSYNIEAAVLPLVALRMSGR